MQTDNPARPIEVVSPTTGRQVTGNAPAKGIGTCFITTTHPPPFLCYPWWAVLGAVLQETRLGKQVPVSSSSKLTLPTLQIVSNQPRYSRDREVAEGFAPSSTVDICKYAQPMLKYEMALQYIFSGVSRSLCSSSWARAMGNLSSRLQTSHPKGSTHRKLSKTRRTVSIEKCTERRSSHRCLWSATAADRGPTSVSSDLYSSIAAWVARPSALTTFVSPVETRYPLPCLLPQPVLQPEARPTAKAISRASAQAFAGNFADAPINGPQDLAALLASDSR